MAFGMRRGDLQAIAQAKLDDAMLLCRHRRCGNAYYLAGFVVEIGLKSCIARTISAETLPDRAFINSVYTHKFMDLISAAGLLGELQFTQNADPSFSAYWGIVNQWSPDKRYTTIDTMTSQHMLVAVNDPNSGVFQWIKKHW